MLTRHLLHAGRPNEKFILETDIPKSIKECLDDPGKFQELEQVAEVLAGKLEWHDAELNQLLKWFDAAYDPGPEPLNLSDYKLAKTIYERLGWRVPDWISEYLIAQGEKQP